MVAIGYSIHFHGTLQEARIDDGRSLKKFKGGTAHNCPKISMRTCAPHSGYQNSKSLYIREHGTNFLELME
jgi:hypothetical protein